MFHRQPIPQPILKQQIELLLSNALPANLTVAAISVLLTISLWELVNPVYLLSWNLLILTTVGMRIGLLTYYERAPERLPPVTWERLYTISTLLVGFSWSGLALMLLTTQDMFAHYAILLVLFGAITVAVPVLSARLPAFFAYILPPAITLVCVLLIQATQWSLLLSVATLIYTGLISATSRNMSGQIRHAITLETRNESLVRHLSREVEQRKAAQMALEQHQKALEQEVVQRTDELSRTNQRLEKEIDSRVQAEDNLKHLAHHDTLTGLPNRLLLDARIEHAIARARRNDTRLALLFLDLDNFKHVNDSLNHLAGDLLLKKVTSRLLNATRDDDTIARLGGDEFVILMEEIRDTNDVICLAQKLLEQLNQVFDLNGESIFVSGSIGISLFPADGENAETLLRNADAAMYRAKEEGRNNYNFYTREMTALAYDRIILESGLRRAIDKDELTLYYQPQKSLQSGRYTSVEALVRWNHPELGTLPPARFLPVAEATGLIVSLGYWVLRKACLQMVEWRNSGLPLDHIAVNLAGKQIRRDDMVPSIRNILQETGCHPQWLELEVTEGFIMTETRHTIAALLKLREMGINLAIDDFGTGYSSLSYLKKLPINRLKIDRSFVQELAEENSDAAIVKAIISMGDSLRLETTAEGVETRFQEQLLKRLGCQQGQGYLYSKPVPKEQIEPLIIQQNRRRTA